jgi:hypothetical protein
MPRRWVQLKANDENIVIVMVNWIPSCEIYPYQCLISTEPVRLKTKMQAGFTTNKYNTNR